MNGKKFGCFFMEFSRFYIVFKGFFGDVYLIIDKIKFFFRKNHEFLVGFAIFQRNLPYNSNNNYRNAKFQKFLL